MSLLLAYRYWVLLPLAIIEGPMLAFVAGILSSLGYLSLPLALCILVIGDIIPDTIFYVLGRYGSSYGFVGRITRKIGVTDDHMKDAESLWKNHPGKTMLMSKFAYGIASAFLFMAGAMRMPPLVFYGYSISISIIHYTAVMSVGYYFGSSILAAGNIVTIVELGIAGAALLISVYVGVMWYMRKSYGWSKTPDKTV